MAARSRLTPYVFLIPSSIFFLAFTFWPILQGLALTTFEWNLFKSPEFVGLKNWNALIERGDFGHSLWVTGRIVLLAVPSIVVLGIAVAVMVDRVGRGKILYRSVFFAPVIASPVAMSFVMRAMFREESGVLYFFLGFLSIANVEWLTSSTGAVSAVVMFFVWQATGNSMLIFLAGLQGIPTTLYESANIDGARPSQTFFRITLPMLSPATFFVLIIQTVNSLQIFAHIYTLTRGGPGYATTAMVPLIHQTAFVQYNMGLAATYSVVLFVLILIVTLLQWHNQRRWVFYG
jgi:ABC-type sugar transport system permease subunit